MIRRWYVCLEDTQVVNWLWFAAFAVVVHTVTVLLVPYIQYVLYEEAVRYFDYIQLV